MGRRLELTDLYRDLVRARVHEAQLARQRISTAEAFAEGAAATVEAVAHLRDTAAMVLPSARTRREKLDRLADALEAEAAAFAHAADVFAEAERACRRSGDPDC